MTEWLAQNGITVGFGDNDCVAALWFTHGFALDKPKGGDEKEVDAEALNAELQEMFKLSVGQGSSGKKKLKVGPLTSTVRGKC
jgi:hypothetical protein